MPTAVGGCVVWEGPGGGECEARYVLGMELTASFRSEWDASDEPEEGATGFLTVDRMGCVAARGIPDRRAGVNCPLDCRDEFETMCDSIIRPALDKASP